MDRPGVHRQTPPFTAGVGDITDSAAVTAGVETIRESLGPIEALVLATAGAGNPVAKASLDRLRSMFEVRVVASLACVQAVRTDLESAGGTVLFSGTSFATGTVTEQIEWGAVAPAAHGLARSPVSALTDVQVTYVRIGSRVDQTASSGALGNKRGRSVPRADPTRDRRDSSL